MTGIIGAGASGNGGGAGCGGKRKRAGRPHGASGKSGTQAPGHRQRALQFIQSPRDIRRLPRRKSGICRLRAGKLPPTAALEWFRSLGLLTVAENSGRVYPYSDQANSVVDVLRFALEKPNITVKLGFEAKKVKKTASGFRIISGDETVECDRAHRRLRRPCGDEAGG